MNTKHGIKILVALAALCLVTASVANASVVEFRLLTDGNDVASYAGPAKTLTLAIQVRTVNAVYYDDPTYGAYLSGVEQYSISLLDSTGITTSSILEPVQGVAAVPPPPHPDGKWAATSATGFIRTAGLVNKVKTTGSNPGSYDVLGETGAIASADWVAYAGTYGGGSGLPSGTTVGPWTTVGSGNIVYKGGEGTLTLVADRLAQTIFNGIAGVMNPDSVVTDSIIFGVVANQAPVMDSVVPAAVAEGDWSKEAGWNNPAHHVTITATAHDPDNGPNPLSFVWTLTNPNTGGTSHNLAATGGVLNLTIAEIIALFPGELPPKGAIVGYNYDWDLAVKAYDGGLYSGTTHVPVFVPEPATIGLLSFGIVGALLRRRRRA